MRALGMRALGSSQSSRFCFVRCVETAAILIALGALPAWADESPPADTRESLPAAESAEDRTSTPQTPDPILQPEIPDQKREAKREPRPRSKARSEEVRPGTAVDFPVDI